MSDPVTPPAAPPAAPPVTPPAKPTRPTEVPEKFWDAEKGEVRVADLAKSYSELEKKTSQPPAAPDPNAPPTETPKGFEVFEAEFVKDQKLSEASYTALEEQGFKKDVVDSFISYRLGMQTAGHEAAGGTEEYQKLSDWAGQNLTDEELTTFNEELSTAKTAKDVADLVTRLKAVRDEEVGDDPKPLPTSKPAANDGIKPYASLDEAADATRDPRYKSDPAFQRLHRQRLSQAKFPLNTRSF